MPAAAAAAACQAVVKRYGAWEVDDAPPVMVEVVEVAGSSGQGSSATAGQDSGPKVSSISIRITGAPGASAGLGYSQVKLLTSSCTRCTPPNSSMRIISREMSQGWQQKMRDMHHCPAPLLPPASTSALTPCVLLLVVVCVCRHGQRHPC